MYAGSERRARLARAHELLVRLGLGERADYQPSQLSGGQQQRVSIARALMNGGEVILADEPTGALDSHSGEEVMAILHQLKAQGHTVIIVTHDPQVAAQAERIVEVGVRDYCDAEAELARSSERIRMFDDTQLSAAAFEGETWGATCRRIVAELPERVYVSFDIDGLTFEDCPHTGTPVAGGLTFNQAVYLLHETVRSGRRIIGFDVVEVVPRPGSSIDASTGARILYKLCGLTLKSEL